MITAKKIEAIVKTGASHTLYRQNGTWYHHLKAFPGVLFDINGYIMFNSKSEYDKSIYLDHGKELTIRGGIFSSALAGVRRSPGRCCVLSPTTVALANQQLPPKTKIFIQSTQ
jgi:hypothetical protein